MQVDLAFVVLLLDILVGVLTYGVTSAGFCRYGIKPGSFAAHSQSYIGNVRSGSWYSLFQRWGAKSLEIYGIVFMVAIIWYKMIIGLEK